MILFKRHHLNCHYSLNLNENLLIQHKKSSLEHD